MAEHNIENFMKLVTNHKSSADSESRSDRYYRKEYEKIRAGKLISWNWSAFAGNTLWLLYRKIYLAAILIPTLSLIYTVRLLLLIPSKETFEANEAILFVTFIFLFLLPFFLLGLFANWLYVRHIHKKIDKGYLLCDLGNVDGMSPVLSVFIPFLGLISGFIISMNDKKKVRRVLLDRQ